MKQNPGSRFEYLIKESRADSLDISPTVEFKLKVADLTNNNPTDTEHRAGHKSDRVLNINSIEYIGEFSWSVATTADQVI